LPDLSQRLQDALSDRYRIECTLGRGGMATVFLAEDLKHHRRVAIKLLDPEVATAIGPERFLREIETVAKLTHPHILPLHDSGVANGLLFYVMPFVEGESLRDRLTREKQLPVEDAARLAGEVADALDYAHRHGVVHRDVKPENILPEETHAVVADFGIARIVAAARGERLTATGIAVGTPAYMSPEQAAGSQDVDGRSVAKCTAGERPRWRDRVLDWSGTANRGPPLARPVAAPTGRTRRPLPDRAHARPRRHGDPVFLADELTPRSGERQRFGCCKLCEDANWIVRGLRVQRLGP